MSRQLRRLLVAPLVRFGLVGSVNTAIDLLVFLALHSAGVPLLLANLISTSCGLAFSFIANRSFTFRSSHTATISHRQVLTFLLGTGIGLWAVQPAVIALTTAALTGHGLTAGVTIVAAKIAGIAVGMAWNWLLYSRWVFRVDRLEQPLTAAQTGPITL